MFKIFKKYKYISITDSMEMLDKKINIYDKEFEKWCHQIPKESYLFAQLLDGSSEYISSSFYGYRTNSENISKIHWKEIPPYNFYLSWDKTYSYIYDTRNGMNVYNNVLVKRKYVKKHIKELRRHLRLRQRKIKEIRSKIDIFFHKIQNRLYRIKRSFLKKFKR